MKNYKIAGLILTVFFITNSITVAKEVPPSSFNLSEEEAVSKAIRNNYDLRSAKISIALAKADLIQAGLWPNPEGDFSISTDKFSANEGEGGWEFGLNQAIPISGRISLQKQVARLGIERAQWQLEDVKRLVIAQARKTYYQVDTLQKEEKILELLVKANQDFLEAAKARLAKAEVSSIDINLARSELLTVTQELSELKARLYEARSNLNQLMVENLASSFIVSPRPLAFPSIDLETATHKALENRPDLKAKAIEKQMGASNLKLARALRIPDITFGGFLQQDKSVIDVNNQPISSSDHLVGLKLSIPLPFFNRNQDEIAKNTAEREGEGIQYDALYLQVSKEVAQAYVRLTTAKEIVNSYENGVMDEMKSSFNLMQNAYSQGQIGIFEVIQFENKYYNIERSYLEASQNAREAIIDFDSVMAVDFQNKKETTDEK